MDVIPDGKLGMLLLRLEVDGSTLTAPDGFWKNSDMKKVAMTNTIL